MIINLILFTKVVDNLFRRYLIIFIFKLQQWQQIIKWIGDRTSKQIQSVKPESYCAALRTVYTVDRNSPVLCE